MCKKILQGLMGGGDQQAAPPPAKAEANYSSGKEAEVLGAVAPSAAGSTTTKLSGGLADPKRKKMGVPGLGL